MRMNERDLSKLWYLADALVREPSRWLVILDTSQNQKVLADPSPAFLRASKGLRAALEKRSKSKVDEGVLRHVAKELLEQEEPLKDAGRALAGALENASA